MLVPRVGFEPTTLSLEVSCSIQLSYQGIMVRDTGVEPVSKVWKTFILTAIRIPLKQGYYTNFNRVGRETVVVQAHQAELLVQALPHPLINDEQPHFQLNAERLYATDGRQAADRNLYPPISP